MHAPNHEIGNLIFAYGYNPRIYTNAYIQTCIYTLAGVLTVLFQMPPSLLGCMFVCVCISVYKYTSIYICIHVYMLVL